MAWKNASLVVLVCALFLVGCHRPYGRFSYTVIDSQSERRPLHYGIYTPPGWDGRTPLPLVVLLHGAGDDQTSADRKVVVDALDEAITRGDVPPVLIVTPEGGRGFWVNWADGTHALRDWVMDEVVPRVRGSYPVIPGAPGLHLMGVSMGGGGGMQIWLREPGVFGSASILSAPILDEAGTRAFLRKFTTDALVDRVFGKAGHTTGIDPYAALQTTPDLQGSTLLFGAAVHDRGNILPSNRAFDQALQAHGIPHHFVEFAGNHSWRTWARVFPYALCRQLNPQCSLAVAR